MCIRDRGIDNTRYTTELPAISLKAQKATGEWQLQIKVAEGEARDSVWPVSYTHLDVYKRQHSYRIGAVI